MSNFFDRVQLLLSGRTLFSWGVAIGLGNSSINRLKAGGELSQKTERYICAVERCSSEWLTSGKGSPFEVNRTQDADETFRAVSELLPMATDTLLVHDGERVAFVIGTPIAREKQTYTEWVVIAGPANTELLELLRSQMNVRVAFAPPSDMQRLIDGDMGNWELVGDIGGTRGAVNAKSVFNKAELAETWMTFKALTDRAFRVAPMALPNKLEETKAVYGTPLSELIDQLSEGHRRAVEVIVRGLLRQH